MPRQLINSLLLCSILCGPFGVLAQQPAASPSPAQSSPTPTSQAEPVRSKVFYGSDPRLMEGYTPNGPAVEQLTDSLVMAVTGQKSVASAWRSLVSPTDHVGIKIAAAGGRDFSTHTPIVAAVLRGLTAAGVPMSQVVIWDRTDPVSVGYLQTPGGPAVRHVEPFSGYEPKTVVTAPVLGKLIWGDSEYLPHGPSPLQPSAREQFSPDSHWSKLICGLNKIINIPVMAASEDCGVAGCVYNVTVPDLDNWRRFVSEPAFGDPFLGELYMDKHVGPKVVINIMDGLIAQYGGGPDWEPHYSWSYATLYAGKDPVAIDATALRMLEGWRKDAKLPPLTEHAKFLRTAAAMGLGNYTQDGIELVETGR